jgi:hypothetical protein
MGRIPSVHCPVAVSGKAVDLKREKRLASLLSCNDYIFKECARGWKYGNTLKIIGILNFHHKGIV